MSRDKYLLRLLFQFCLSSLSQRFVPWSPKLFHVPLSPKTFFPCSLIPQLKWTMFPCSPPPTQTLLGFVMHSFPTNTLVRKERVTSPKSVCVGGYCSPKPLNMVTLIITCWPRPCKPVKRKHNRSSCSRLNRRLTRSLWIWTSLPFFVFVLRAKIYSPKRSRI